MVAELSDMAEDVGAALLQLFEQVVLQRIVGQRRVGRGASVEQDVSLVW